ncbi:uncharacterized protein LOC129883435 [Solanum dulcamara]|uniref:uncharacterized protein LOC129883435 n=1 Tax=Solanum dulcamara TaxID=45834 RepID=UPI0024861820|nr:uncharacterized protein LOC129883435 [Solanum dulcamara]
MDFMQKTRGSVAKVKVQMDITKPRIQSVWIGFDENDDPNREGRWQDIEYDDIPLYCTYCKHQSHTPLACPVSRRDAERNKAKNKEEEPKKDESTKNTDNRYRYKKQPPQLKEEETKYRNTQTTRTGIKSQTTNGKPKREENSKERPKPYKTTKRYKATLNRYINPLKSELQSEHRSGIDSMLPIPHGSPCSRNVLNVLTAAAEVVNGGEDGGFQEKPINLQDGGEDSTPTLHNMDLPTITQPNDNTDGKLDTTSHTTPLGSMVKELGSVASTSVTGSNEKKNKLSKRRRDALKKRTEERNLSHEEQISLVVDNVKEQHPNLGCQQFVLEDDQVGMDITPLQTQYNHTPPQHPASRTAEQHTQSLPKCTLNTNTNIEVPPDLDEYAVIESEDEGDYEDQPLKDLDEEDAASEHLNRPLGTSYTNEYDDEIQ